MKWQMIRPAEIAAWVKQIPSQVIRAVLFGGDRLTCCDEAVGIKIDGQIVGIATIAPQGEENSGEPTIVGVYILPDYRRQGLATRLLQETITRCRERGFAQVRIDVMSDHLQKAIDKLSPTDQAFLRQVKHSGNLFDLYTELETK